MSLIIKSSNFHFQNDKRNGYTNVGELEGCVHFKIGEDHRYNLQFVTWIFSLSAFILNKNEC